MKPKRYPYSGKKKQSHEEIAELKKQIAVNKSMIIFNIMAMRARGNLTIREKRWIQLLEFYLSFGLLCFLYEKP